MSDASAKESRFIYVLYGLARFLAFPLLVLYFLYRGYRDPRYFRRFMERLGTLPATYKRTAPGSIWLHAVSMGEVISSTRLIAELRAANPHIPIYLSTTTLSGRTIAEQKLTGHVNGIFYAPVDYAFAVRRVLRRIRPAVVVVLETEIWPVLYREVKRAGCALLILNGRISDRALPRYRRFRAVFRAALCWPDAIYVQSDSDRERYIDIGAPAARVIAAGNLKYDAAPTQAAPPAAVAQLMARLQPGPVWIAASTMPGADEGDVDENEIVLQAFAQLAHKYPRLLLILAPRKPERFDEIAGLLQARGIAHARRTRLDSATILPLPGILLLDTIGELATLFPLADVVFMGGTVARRGGHNILEPAFAARAIVIGPHMENFSAIAREFRAAEAVAEIRGAGELAPAVDALLSDSARRDQLGRLALDLADRKRGVTARAVHNILEAQDRAVPFWNQRGFRKALAGLLSLLWQWGGRLRGAHPRPLSTPVVSVGGIAMGGSGKTPFVLMLARRFRDRGMQPAILTRGYRRRSLASMLIIEAGATLPASITGDEAQIFVRSRVAHVGICSDRWAAGHAMEGKERPDVFLLDDGFQHRRLERDLDVVLIDALDPFAGGAVFPRGRLREPLTALARAGMFVITRAQPGREYRGIRERLAAFNPAAPVFLATVEPARWVHAATSEETAQPAGPVAAFCGLGNPASFWETVALLGIDPVFTWAFGDHHVYKPLQIRRLAAQARRRGAAVLITTEKDAMNLPDNFARIIAPVELYFLQVETRVEKSADLLAQIENAIATARRRTSQPLSERPV